MVPIWIKGFVYRSKTLAKVYSYARGLFSYWNTRKYSRRLKREGRYVLGHIANVLNERKIVYFGNYGTLLGAIRENGFLKNDDDLDFSIPPGGASPQELLDAFAGDEEMIFMYAFEWNGAITEISYTCHGVPIDFFFQYMEDGVNYSHWYDSCEGKYVNDKGERYAYRRPIPVPVNIQQKEFSCGLIPVPNNAVDILESAYGNWQKPSDKYLDANYEDLRPAKKLLSIPGHQVFNIDEVCLLLKSH